MTTADSLSRRRSSSRPPPPTSRRSSKLRLPLSRSTSRNSSPAPADPDGDDGGQQQSTAAASNITRGGTLRFSTPAATHDYFDPHRAVFGPTQFWMGFYMNYLIRWQNKEKGILESDIASLPEIPDEETYIFSIDRGARFWDQYPTEGGREVTAQDIEANFQRQIDAADSTGAEDSTFLGASAFRKTASMDTPDAQTFIARSDGVDATWISTPLRPFSWITSPEAISEFGDRWRDEATNVELSSGTGPYIPQSYDPDIGMDMTRNDNYWKMGADGQPLPYMDAIGMENLTDPTAVEAAYRGKQIDVGGFPLSSVQAAAIGEDFPDHPQGQIAFGFTIITGIFNYNPDWPGEDGLGNPYLDRRFCYALHLAVDRYLMIDAVYLGSGKPSGQEHTPWYNTYWAIPEEELLSTPGYRPDRDLDIADARQYLDASGYDKDRPLLLYAPDIWEQTYQGILETEKSMYEEALGIEVSFNIQPYTVLLQRWVSKTYPGGGPQWTNPPRRSRPHDLLPAESDARRGDQQPLLQLPADDRHREHDAGHAGSRGAARDVPRGAAHPARQPPRARRRGAGLRAGRDERHRARRLVALRPAPRRYAPVRPRFAPLRRRLDRHDAPRLPGLAGREKHPALITPPPPHTHTSGGGGGEKSAAALTCKRGRVVRAALRRGAVAGLTLWAIISRTSRASTGGQDEQRAKLLAADAAVADEPPRTAARLGARRRRRSRSGTGRLRRRR